MRSIRPRAILPRSPSSIKSVTDLRAQRGVAIGVGAGMWIIDALWAAYGAHVHNQRIADDRF